MRTKEWTYKTTHPWITFELDPASFTSELWVLLGECQSKCEHVAGVPLRPETAREFSLIYLTKGVKSTTAIEGSSLSEEQVRDRVNQADHPQYTDDYRIQEVDNIVGALNQTLLEFQYHNRSRFSLATILNYNKQVLAKLPIGKDVNAGSVRNHAIGVGLYRGIAHEECEYCLTKLCEWINELEVIPNNKIVNAIVRAILAHLYIAWIHPFSDGNGRTARLVEVELLLGAGVPVPSAHMLSNHFNATRNEYYNRLEQTSISGGDVIPFLQYAVKGFLDGLELQFWRIRDEQWDSIWINHVHEVFRNKNSEADKRRRNLVLDLSSLKLPISKDLITKVFPQAASAYAGLTQKTISRDISTLVSQGLIEVNSSGEVNVNRKQVLAFTPPRIDEINQTYF